MKANQTDLRIKMNDQVTEAMEIIKSDFIRRFGISPRTLGFAAELALIDRAKDIQERDLEGDAA